MMRNVILLALALAALSNHCLAKPQVLSVFVYHDEAPLHLDSSSIDLSQAWAKAMNAQQTRYRFVIQKIARPALNHWVEGESPFMILWANTLWFRSRDTDIKASNPIFWDADVVVSLRENPVQFQTFDELVGLKIGARKGHYYKGLMDYFSDARIQRIDSDSSRESYEKLKRGKINAYIDSRSSILFAKRHDQYSEPIYVAALPHDAFSRHLIVSSHYFDLLPFINNHIERLKESTEWQQYVEEFAIQRIVDPFELDLNELNRY